MQVGTYDTIPAWLVAIFAMTNITQGILGFWLTSKYIRKREHYKANLLGAAAWFVFWFILVHGWDGTGYKRFFHASVDWSGNVTPWVNGAFEWYSPIKWAFSPVAISLLVMGIIMMPFLNIWMLQLNSEDRRAAEKEGEGGVMPLRVSMCFRAGCVDALAAAIAASLLIHLLGWILGVILFIPIAYFALIRKGGFTEKALRPHYVRGNAAVEAVK
jgi:hypothetical protein